MGCFLGCFGGEKGSEERQRRRKPRGNRASPQRQRNRIQNVQQENLVIAEQSVAETAPINLVSEVSELRNEAEVVEQLSQSPSQSLSPSPRKRVTFNSNVTTYEHVPVHESIESLPGCAENGEEKQGDLKTSSHSRSISKDEDDSVTSSVGSYPPNHRYHNARESDDEAEEYGDIDLDDEDDEYEDDYSDDEEEYVNTRFLGHEVWTESVLTASMESRTGNSSPPAIRQEVESPMVKTQLPNDEVNKFEPRTNARDRSDYVNSVLNPVENLTQWKAVKSKGTSLLKQQKENSANFETPRLSFSSEPMVGQTPSSFKAKSKKNANQEIAVDTSLSNWLGAPEVTPSKKSSFGGFEVITKSPQSTTSEGCYSAVSFEDRPILGALTVEELRQISASPSPRKSPSRSPDEMPIIGTVGTYWNNSGSAKHSGSATSFKGIPNTTSKYREDKKVNWHSTPFETRLDRALNQGAA